MKRIRTPRIETLADLFIRSTQWCGQRELFVDGAHRIGGEEALAAALRLAAAFEGAGAEPGQVVAFLCRSSARHAVAWFAAPLGGYIACNLHVRETPQKLGHVLAWLGAKVLVHDDDLADIANEAIAFSGLSPAQISLGERGTAPTSWSEIVGGDRLFDPLLRRLAPDAPAAIVLSSGTTGEPKGIVHSQRTLLETAKAQFGLGGITPRTAGVLFMEPSFAAWAIIVLPLVGGKAKVVFGRQFTPEAFLQACQGERITFAPLVPTMWRRIFSADLDAYDLSSLEVVSVGGEPPSASDVDMLRRRICPNIVSQYVSSELFTASAIVASRSDFTDPARIGSGGVPGVGVDMKIIDPAGSFDDEVPTGVEGEIAVSGPSVAIGYWKDPELTAKRFRDGWWRSGDLGRIDENGLFWVTGRIDNVINTGGIKVSAEEIEAALMKHPSIAQCAVVGRQDSNFGRRIEAFCVPRGEMPTNEALAVFLRETCGLASFKIPKAFHMRTEFPTGPTGKLYRKGLVIDV